MNIIATLRKVDRIYWVFLIVAVIAHTVAGASTWYALKNVLARECNPFQSEMLATDSGAILSTLVSTIAIIFIIFFVPLLNNEIEKIGKYTAGCLVFFVGFLTLDAVHDILVLMQHPASEITVRILGIPYILPQYLLNIPYGC